MPEGRKKTTYDERIAELEAELEKPVELELEFRSGWNTRFPVKVQFGKGREQGKVTLTNATIGEIRKHAIFVAKERQKRTRNDIANLKQKAKAMKSLLEKKGDMTFEQFAMIYNSHVEGKEVVPGFELVAQSSLGGRYSRYSYRQTDTLWRAIEASKLLKWDRSNEPKPTEPGALSTKKLSELEPEDCFLRVHDGHRVPRDTTLHNYVRKVLNAAVSVGVIETNPASLKVPRNTVKVKAVSAGAALREHLGDKDD